MMAQPMHDILELPWGNSQDILEHESKISHMGNPEHFVKVNDSRSPI